MLGLTFFYTALIHAWTFFAGSSYVAAPDGSRTPVFRFANNFGAW